MNHAGVLLFIGVVFALLSEWIVRRVRYSLTRNNITFAMAVVAGSCIGVGFVMCFIQ